MFMYRFLRVYGPGSLPMRTLFTHSRVFCAALVAVVAMAFSSRAGQLPLPVSQLGFERFADKLGRLGLSHLSGRRGLGPECQRHGAGG